MDPVPTRCGSWSFALEEGRLSDRFAEPPLRRLTGGLSQMAPSPGLPTELQRAIRGNPTSPQGERSQC
ncbi:hypothetical protein MES5069_950006 [Mesorhizobium escarrei]|uniref:Propionyl-coenzyme A carboxylase alpha polypeptide n=1 Tax=Mesorhizobium escarrei TaxID=666018 RepID=A0ABN8KK78_9HYPH|nr:hypothetical protein MES5069_950006 [Mesorhizobium escarrei]